MISLASPTITFKYTEPFHSYGLLFMVYEFYIGFARWWPEPYCTKAFIGFGSSSTSQSKRKKRKLQWQQKTKASLQSL